MTSSNQNVDIPQGQIWADLAHKAQGGDKRAYTKLLTDILPFIKYRIAGGLANPDWADDIAQDVLISVHKSLATYSADRPFKPWLNAIIQFRKTDFLRKHYKVKKVKESVQGNVEIFSQNVTFQEGLYELKDIQSAIASLPAKQQKIFKMMKVEGYSAKEVAADMEMSVSAVKVSAHRAASKLREILG